MPHPQIENHTAFFADALHLVDEQFAPRLTVATKATFDILPGGFLARAADQRPLDLVGQFQEPGAESSSYRYEPEVAPFKLATDVVLVGHAHAPSPGTTRMDVGLRVGPLMRSLRVYGDRVWVRTLGSAVLTRPLPFERIPLCYERAFGGWDKGSADPQQWTCEPRNPVGRGFHGRRGRRRGPVLAPNLEYIEHPIRSPNHRPAPACFGFVSPHWQPRQKLAGTHDARWRTHRFPRLAANFDRRHHNAASAGLVAPGYLRGDEHVVTLGLSPEGHLGFALPGVPPPLVRVSLCKQLDHQPRSALDTIIIDLDDRRLTMIWRASMLLPNGAHDVRAVEVTSPASLALPRSDRSNPATRGANTCPSP
ncbi:MAG: DUF2169 domain-containing protein [Myxococcota bacterium]